MTAYKQFALNFPNKISYDHDTYATSSCNMEAYNWLMSKAAWGSYGLMLTGPKGCGKTHLAHIWQHITQARFISLSDLQADLVKLIRHNNTFIIEDIDQLTNLQAELFHLLNLIREDQKTILLTTTDGLDQKIFVLKDLMTRLKSLPMAIIHSPDDIMCRAIMIKRFADMQLHINDRVIHYLLMRAERSYENIHHIIENIYQLSKSCQQKITLPFIKSILLIPLIIA